MTVAGDLSVDGNLIGGTHYHSNYVDQYEFKSHIYDANAHHARYTNEEAVNAVLAPMAADWAWTPTCWRPERATPMTGRATVVLHYPSRMASSHMTVRSIRNVQVSSTYNILDITSKISDLLAIITAVHAYVTLITAPGIDALAWVTGGGKMRVWTI